MRKWREANPDKVRKYRRTTYENQKGRNPQEYRTKARKRQTNWRERNELRNCELQRESYARHKDQRLVEKKIYSEQFPDRIRANNKRQRAKRANAHIGDESTQKLTHEYWETLYHDPCSYCRSPTSTVDHIVSIKQGGTHTWDNLTAACASCNASKHTRSLWEFLWLKQRGG